jgi:hypothetical protein
MGKNQGSGIRDKHPGSAPLVTGTLRPTEYFIVAFLKIVPFKMPGKFRFSAFLFVVLFYDTPTWTTHSD